MDANANSTVCLVDGGPALRFAQAHDGEPAVLAVAPLRVDLTGGFTDIPPFSSSIDSLHINAAFDLTVSVRIQARRDRLVRVSFVRDAQPALARVPEGRRRFLDAVRAGVAEFSRENGLELSIGSDAPAGSGLGSSGSILVAAINGCAKLVGVAVTPVAVAQKAVVAAAAAGIVGGRQDEFAAAHGSLRAYQFNRGGEAQVWDLDRPEVCRYLEESLLVIQMGTDGRRTDVVADVVRAVRGGDRETVTALSRLQDLALDLFEILKRGSVTEVPRCMARIRETQCALHPRMCCPRTAEAMEAIRAELPVEYKMLGGGGAGSCVLVHVPLRERTAAVSMLRRCAKKVFAIKIQPSGVLTERIDGSGQSQSMTAP